MSERGRDRRDSKSEQRERGGIGNGIRRIKCDTVQICLRENDARHWSEA